MTIRNDFTEQFSAESIASGHAGPRRCLASSLTARWSSLLVQRFESPSNVDPFETLATPDQLLVVKVKGQCAIKSFSNGSWKTSAFQPGHIGMTAGGCTNRLCWQSRTPDAHESIHIHIPQDLFTAVEDEYRRAGAPPRIKALDALSFYDPVISQVAHSLMDAIKGGAPNLYAQSAAQFLVTHLLSRRSGSLDPTWVEKQPGTFSTRRLAHVLEYMSTHFDRSLSLETLAKEAGVSRFHFGRLFKEKVGVTPHRHLMNIRMDAAASLLGRTELSIVEIALACGYQSAAHFTAAFQKHFFQTPSSYRQSLQGDRVV